MLWKKLLFMCCMVGLAGCEISPVDRALISDTPADAKSFAVAQQAVRACRYTLNSDKALDSFRRSGFGVTQRQIKRGRRTINRIDITPPDDAVSVLYQGTSCTVGLRNMTPSQSYELARIWAKAFDAKSIAEYGDGLSGHVSGAWRLFYTEYARAPDQGVFKHRINIAAYKTFPYGPYDPQKNVGYSIEGLFPDAPGAAVKLVHVVDCNPNIAPGQENANDVPCTGSKYSRW